jgi:tetratricopeptide (TPR) repeat protein
VLGARESASSTPALPPDSSGRVPAAHGTLAAAALAVAAVLLAHGASLANGFVWDDQHTVLGNAALRSLEGLLHSFKMDDWQAYGLRPRGLYRPLATASLFLDHGLYGFRSAGYHLTNLALHAFTTFALMRVLAAAGVRPLIALASGALFAVHPITSEVADWISARPDGLSTALTAGALLAALRDRPRLGATLAASAAFGKEPGLAALPAVFFVVAARAQRRPAIQAGLVGAAGLTAYFVLRNAAAVPVNAGAARLAQPSGWVEVAAQFGRAVGGWVKAVAWPLPLEATRRLPDLGAWSWLAAGLAATTIAAALLGLVQHRSSLPAALALLWGLPLVLAGAYGAGLSERYLYLPTAAAAVALALAAEWAIRRHAAAVRPALGRLALVGCAGLAIAGGAASAARAREWNDPLSLFAGAAKADPENADAWQLYGAELHRRGEQRRALEAFERAAALGSSRAGLYSNLCAVRREVGDLERAASDCDRAVRLDPADPRPRYNRALLLAALGRRGEAAAELEALLRDYPGYRPARDALPTLAEHRRAPAVAPDRE